MTPRPKLLPDRRHAPKKTGKRLPPPEDPADRLVTTQSEMSAGPKTLLVEQPPRPKVVGDRMQVFYLKPYFQKDAKTGKLSVAMAFSLALDKEHRALLPKIVADGYHDILKKGRKSMALRSIPGQHAQIYISHDAEEELLNLPAAHVTNAALALIERKGEGSARKVIRLSFRLQVPIPKDAKTDSVSYFAERNLQNDFWLTLNEASAKLFEDEDEEADDEG